jgi:HD-GYP domain-containing protein (c-di-GMP phosphodiesterase class II)
MHKSYMIYAIPPLIASLGNLFLGGLVLGKKPTSRMHQVFAFFSLCVAIWSFGFFMVYVNAGNKETALLWNKFYSIGMVMIPVVYLHFVLIITDTKSKVLWRICNVSYAVSIAIVLTVPTHLFNKDLTLLYWGYSPVRGITGMIYDALYPLLITIGAIQLFRGLKTSFGHRRAQIKFGILASCIGFGLGLTNFLPLYGVRMYPIGHIGNFVANCLIAYSIMKFSFLDMNVIIRKSAVYTVLTGIVAAAYIGVVFFTQSFLQGLTGYTSVYPVIILALIVAITFEPTRRNVQLFVDKVFFRKNYEYQKVIMATSEKFRTLISPIEIASCLLDAITEALHPKNAWIMSYDRQSDKYLVVAARSIPAELQVSMAVDRHERLVEQVEHHNRPVWFDDQDEHILRRKVDRDSRNELENLGLNMICPIQGKSGLLAILFLGDRKSGAVFTDNDAELLETLCSQAAFSIENSKLYDDLQASYLNTVRSLVAALEAKDEYTKGHSERVAGYAKSIAVEMGLSDKESQLLYEVSLLHDVGKIGVSEQILNKKSKLSKAEYLHVQSHTTTGEKILSSVESIKDGLSAVRHHHERLNGDGYPDGLSESNIPLTARILAAADAFDAMTTKRPYRKAMTFEEAIDELKAHSCQQFDPQVVRAFIAVLVRSKRQGTKPVLGISHIRHGRRLKTA